MLYRKLHGTEPFFYGTASLIISLFVRKRMYFKRQLKIVLHGVYISATTKNVIHAQQKVPRELCAGQGDYE